MSRFSRVLLIGLAGYLHRPRPPAGLGYVSQALCQAGIPNAVVDFQLDTDLSTLKQRCQRFAADLVAVSMLSSFGHRRGYAVIESVRDWLSNVAIVVGGPHVSTMRERVLQDCGAVDFGVTLEGEETIVELCRSDAPISDVQGLLHREPGGSIGYAGDRPFIEDLDTQGFPRYERFELNQYARTIGIVSSRGCPHQCIYCAVPLGSGTKYRTRSARSVADEIEHWYARGYRDFRFLEVNLTLGRDRALGICDELEVRRLSGLRLAGTVRADRVDRELLGRMGEVGFVSLEMGVEAGNDRILSRLKKGESIGTIAQAMKDAHELGLELGLNFLVGSPGETEADVMDSVRLAQRYPVHRVKFFNLTPIPNTELFAWVSENDRFLYEPEDYLDFEPSPELGNEPVFETPELSRKQRRRLLRWTRRIARSHNLRIQRPAVVQHVAKRLQALGVPVGLSQPLAKLYVSVLVPPRQLARRLWGKVRLGLTARSRRQGARTQ